VFFARDYGLADLVTMDMGGTSFDACLIRDGKPAITSRSEVAEYALALPVLDINAIGAGGGSIARVADGILQVGPQSAGAVPGPAAYGQGGALATVTDADVVLGYIDPGHFLGGRKRLDAAAAARAIRDTVAAPLGLTTVEAALGIMRIVDANMADGVRAISVARGFDVRDACLVAAGGAGPLHACGIADELEMELILVPRASAVFCASGMLATDLRQDVVHHAAIRLKDPAEAIAAINDLRARLIAQGEAILDAQGVEASRRGVEFSATMLFEGQFNATETPLPMLTAPVDTAGLGVIRRAFETVHERVYGYLLEGEPVEIQSLRLTVTGRRTALPFPLLPRAGIPAAAARKGARLAWFGARATETPVYDGALLEAGHEMRGPALIEQPATTIKIAPGWRGRVDERGNLLMWRAGADLSHVLARLRHGPEQGEIR
jgi:N-methylhydantoinase A